ncbi:MAG: DUF882 domain-containing protein [Alphaproteobacteria bacterium]
MTYQPGVAGGMGMPSRRGLLRALGAGALLLAARPALAVVAEGRPDRRLHLHNVNTLETVDLVYYRDGRYDRTALGQLDRFLRDHRTGRSTRMDPGLYDFLHDLQRRVSVDGAEPTKIVSAYRAAETNGAKRRKHERGVARNSYHLKGQAFDVVLPDRDVRQVRDVAVALHRGGVGVYPRSHFLHLDVGPDRTW